MEAQRQPDSPVPPAKAGSAAAQGVVELQSACASGLTVWARQRFEVGAEIQLLLHGAAALQVPALASLKTLEGWLRVRGFVVGCKPARRPDGSTGFEITLVFDPALLSEQRRSRRAAASACELPPAWGYPHGLN